MKVECIKFQTRDNPLQTMLRVKVRVGDKVHTSPAMIAHESESANVRMVKKWIENYVTPIVEPDKPIEIPETPKRKFDFSV